MEQSRRSPRGTREKQPCWVFRSQSATIRQPTSPSSGRRRQYALNGAVEPLYSKINSWLEAALEAAVSGKTPDLRATVTRSFLARLEDLGLSSDVPAPARWCRYGW